MKKSIEEVQKTMDAEDYFVVRVGKGADKRVAFRYPTFKEMSAFSGIVSSSKNVLGDGLLMLKTVCLTHEMSELDAIVDRKPGLVNAVIKQIADHANEDIEVEGKGQS